MLSLADGLDNLTKSYITGGDDLGTNKSIVKTGHSYPDIHNMAVLHLVELFVYKHCLQVFTGICLLQDMRRNFFMSFFTETD